MRVGVDASELRPGAPGGVRTALHLLLDALHRYAPEVRLEALAPGPVPVPAGVKLVPTGGPARPSRWRRSRALRRALHGVDLFHSPVTAVPPRTGPVLTATVHELPFMAAKRLEKPARVAAQCFWLTRAMGRCRALFVPSRATWDQVLGIHPAAARRMHVVPHPAPPAPNAEQHQHDGSLLCVGRLDRRKGVERLLAGVARSELPMPCKLAGPHAAPSRARVERAAQRLGLSEQLLFLGAVDDATLDSLYRKACAVGFVSVSEGFGFPVLEALARGVPVIVARGTGASETGGDAVLAVDADDPDEIAAALARAADPEFREAVRSKGPARVMAFPPERTARAYEEVFRRALDG